MDTGPLLYSGRCNCSSAPKSCYHLEMQTWPCQSDYLLREAASRVCMRKGLCHWPRLSQVMFHFILDTVSASQVAVARRKIVLGFGYRSQQCRCPVGS